MRYKLWICVAANVWDDRVRRFCRIPLTSHNTTCFNISSVHQLAGPLEQDALSYTSGGDCVFPGAAWPSSSSGTAFPETIAGTWHTLSSVLHVMRQTADRITRGGAEVWGGGMEDLWKAWWEVKWGWGWTGRGWCGWSGGGQRSEVTVLRLVPQESKADTGCFASWQRCEDRLRLRLQLRASGNCDQQAALCQRVLVPQLDFWDTARPSVIPPPTHTHTPSWWKWRSARKNSAFVLWLSCSASERKSPLGNC